jgi:hypothetical protein
MTMSHKQRAIAQPSSPSLLKLLVPEYFNFLIRQIQCTKYIYSSYTYQATV